MAKLKLKTVQNVTGNGNMSLLEDGTPRYVNDEGYTIFGSGILDNSGNVVDQGWIEISGGMDTIQIGVDPVFTFDVTWGSGEFVLPLPLSYGEHGCETCVDVEFEEPVAGNSAANIFGITPIEAYGLNPLTVRWSFQYHRGNIMDMEYGFVTIPFTYHKPLQDENK